MLPRFVIFYFALMVGENSLDFLFKLMHDTNDYMEVNHKVNEQFSYLTKGKFVKN
jgi:hypothetical protein